MPRHTHPQPAGFTMVELVIVLLVVAIGSAMAVPMFTGNTSAQLRGAAQLLAADLDAAKVESITHADDPRVVVFDLTNHTYQIAPSSSPAVAITNPFDRKPYVVDFGKGRASALPQVTLDSIDLDGDNQLGFGIYGQL
ncbi:MAG: prepilin-type N-terminal cleavage/methylation domain-containing protein, partial [Planctomycetota bacterium]